MYLTHPVEARSIDFRMPMGLEGIEDCGAFREVRGADLFFAGVTKGHCPEDNGQRGFWGGHFWVFERRKNR
jgi:hypothetical protein